MRNSTLDNRHIRVFISSTFKDMEKEREYLIKKVFPLLRKKAAKRGVVVTELDLRWGITKEESENGKVLEICLTEIDNSRPFFIGLLGDRYGWCPTEDELKKNHNLEELYPWVRQAIADGKSVTEMEFLYGAMSPKFIKDKNIDAYFWIKKNSHSDEDGRLEQLKHTVRENQFYPCCEYNSVEDLGTQVAEVFEKILEERYPFQNLTSDELYSRDQQFFRDQLCNLYVPIKENLFALTQFEESQGSNVMVMVGESGSGKSSTIANWLRQKENVENRLYLCCFLQASDRSAELGNILGFFNAELQRLLGQESQNILSDSATQAEEDFKRLLGEVPQSMHVVLVIDGVNYLDDPDAKLLNWIPPHIEGCKVVLTTTEDDETYNSARRRDFEIVSIALMKDWSQKKQFIETYLNEYGKSLAKEQIQKLTHSPITDTPGHTRTILSELKNSSSFDDLDDRINLYSNVKDVSALYQIIISSAKNTYGKEMVDVALVGISVSRNGLSEDTILAMLNVTPLHWSYFFCAFNDFFSLNNGLISIADSNLKRHVLEQSNEHIEEVRRLIIDKINVGSNDREIFQEIPYQLWMLKEYHSLNKFIARYDVDVWLYLFDQEKLFKYWRDICKTKQPLSRYYWSLSNLNCGAYAYKGAFMHRVEQYNLSIFYCIQELMRNLFRVRMRKSPDELRDLLSYNMTALFYLSGSLFRQNRYRLARIASIRMRTVASKHSEYEISNYFYQMANVNIANCDLMLGKNKVASAVFDNVLENKHTETDLLNMESNAITLMNAVSTYLITDKEKAKSRFEEANEMFGKFVQTNPKYIDVYIQLLLMSPAVFTNDIQKIKDNLETALNLTNVAKTAGIHLQPSTLARLYSVLAETSDNTEAEKAIKYCDKAVDDYSGLVNDKDILSGVLLTCLGVYTTRGEYEKARILVSKMLELPPVFTKYNKMESRCWALFYYYQAILVFDTDSELSEKFLQHSISYFNKMEKDIRSDFYYASALDSIGRIMYNKREYKEALKYFKHAEIVYKNALEFNYDDNALCQLAYSTNLRGLSHMYSNNYSTAYVILKDNLERVKQIPLNHPLYYQLMMSSCASMVDACLNIGETNQARTHLLLALDAAKKGDMDKSVIDRFNDALNNMSE